MAGVYWYAGMIVAGATVFLCRRKRKLLGVDE